MSERCTERSEPVLLRPFAVPFMLVAPCPFASTLGAGWCAPEGWIAGGAILCSWADKFWLTSVPRRSTHFIFLWHLCVDRARQRPIMSCENIEKNVPVADGAGALGARPPLLDVLTILVVAREAALAADALAGRVRRGEGARNDAAIRTCTDMSRVRRAGWGGTYRS